MPTKLVVVFALLLVLLLAGCSGCVTPNRGACATGLELYVEHGRSEGRDSGDAAYRLRRRDDFTVGGARVFVDLTGACSYEDAYDVLEEEG